ncbi:MAG: tRNA (adenosine(37)-N6)-threonylcarbamoyltransferase complex dimerization subunit type 1 TsaB [Clostridiales bacterium]|nr:tRNA (adenosine(37)-N6)-threonylcarbamoyltransferase complex dimerization subunit type 1 TsaB [Clostridiales bacterium]
MLILGIESATPVASAALIDEAGLLGEVMLNVGLTHSEQLLPMIDTLLGQCRRRISDVTAIGVSAGPGSFTGLRIGMATAKALAQGLSHLGDGQGRQRQGQVLAIPTLEAMAWAMAGQTVWASPMLNARRNQIYTALYRWQGSADADADVGADAEAGADAAGIKKDSQWMKDVFASRQRGKKERIPAGYGEGNLSLTCCIQPRATSPEAWADEMASYMAGNGHTVYLLGDGATIYREIWDQEFGIDARVMPPTVGLCRGSYIAFAAMEAMQAGRDDLYNSKPIYLRGI